MRSVFVAFLCAVALVGCQPAEQARPIAAGTASVAEFQPSEQFVGTWTGTTAAGNDIRIVIPAGGTPTYAFRGSAVPVTSARVSGDTVVLSVGRSGDGSIVLSPVTEGQLQYDYRFGGDRATAVLVRS